MPDQFQSTSLDTAPYSERLRRALYDAVVRTLFTPSPRKDQLLAELKGEPPEDVPTYSPEEAGLVVFWAWGRWFAVWYDLDSKDETHLPLSRKWQVVRIQADPSKPDAIQLHEV